jgi:hypothetical protein
MVFSESGNVAEAIIFMLQKSAEHRAQVLFNMMNDIRKYYPRVYKTHFNRLHVDECQRMEKMLQRGIEEGVFRDDLNPEIIAHFFCKHKQDDLFAHYDRILDKFSLVDIFENLVITFLRGVCTVKGIDIIDKYKKSK